MATEKVIVCIDAVDLEQAPMSTADAILANVKTSVLLKGGQPVAKDEFWVAVDAGEVRQFNHERAEQHDEQARYKASRSAAVEGTTEDAN